MEIEKDIKQKIQIVLLGLLIAGGLFVLEYFSSLPWLRNGISYAYNPLTFRGGEIGSNLRSYISLFTDIGDFRDEYNALKIRNLELEVFEDYNKILTDQNESFRRQIELGNKKEEYVLAQIFYSVNTPGELMTNEGSEGGVSEGDIALLGNLYIGVVEEVDVKGSVLRLPTSRASNLRVLIARKADLTDVDLETISEKYVSQKSVEAVAVGVGNEIRLENIPVDSGVRNGDSVIVADERVGEYLLLGRIEDLDKDLAATTVSAKVSRIVEYRDLTNIFIRISK
jgi:cell shape-determining protein MreC